MIIDFWFYCDNFDASCPIVQYAQFVLALPLLEVRIPYEWN